MKLRLLHRVGFLLLFVEGGLLPLAIGQTKADTNLEPIPKPARRGGQAHLAPKTPQNEPAPGRSGIGSKKEVP